MRQVFRSQWFLGALLVALVALAYSPSLLCGFIWDDDVGIFHNDNLRSIEGLQRIWTEPSMTPQGHYWPLVYASFWVEFQLWELNPFGYHFTNILLQAINTLLLWRLLLRLGDPRRLVRRPHSLGFIRFRSSRSPGSSSERISSAVSSPSPRSFSLSDSRGMDPGCVISPRWHSSSSPC